MSFVEIGLPTDSNSTDLEFPRPRKVGHALRPSNTGCFHPNPKGGSLPRPVQFLDAPIGSRGPQCIVPGLLPKIAHVQRLEEAACEAWV